MGCHSLLQEIFPTQGSSLFSCISCLGRQIPHQAIPSSLRSHLSIEVYNKAKRRNLRLCSPGVKRRTSSRAQNMLASRQRAAVVRPPFANVSSEMNKFHCSLILSCVEISSSADSLTLLLGILSSLLLKRHSLGACHFPLVLSVSTKSSSSCRILTLRI